MKVLVCGSRDWSEPGPILTALVGAIGPFAPDGVLVIEGGARGADTIAKRIAGQLGCRVHTERADWKRHGKAAGPIRNLAMLDQQPDLVLAFQRNRSRGTQHTIDQARKRGIPVEVVAD